MGTNLDSGLVSGDDYPHHKTVPSSGDVKMIIEADASAHIRVTTGTVTGTGTDVADFIIPVPDDADGAAEDAFDLSANYSVYFMLSSDARY